MIVSEGDGCVVVFRNGGGSINNIFTNNRKKMVGSHGNEVIVIVTVCVW